MSTRERILDAAEQLFADEGIDGAGMRGIAAAAGVAVTTLYSNFGAKAGVVKAVFERRGFVVDPPLELPAGLLDRVRAVALGQFEAVDAQYSFFRLLARQVVSGDEATRGMFDHVAEAWRQSWEDVLAGAEDVDPAADLAAASEALRSGMWGVIVIYASHRDAEHARARIEAIADFVAAAVRR